MLLQEKNPSPFEMLYIGASVWIKSKEDRLLLKQYTSFKCLKQGICDCGCNSLRYILIEYKNSVIAIEGQDLSLDFVPYEKVVNQIQITEALQLLTTNNN